MRNTLGLPSDPLRLGEVRPTPGVTVAPSPYLVTKSTTSELERAVADLASTSQSEPKKNEEKLAGELEEVKGKLKKYEKAFRKIGKTLDKFNF